MDNTIIDELQVQLRLLHRCNYNQSILFNVVIAVRTEITSVVQ